MTVGCSMAGIVQAVINLLRNCGPNMALRWTVGGRRLLSNAPLLSGGARHRDDQTSLEGGFLICRWSTIVAALPRRRDGTGAALRAGH
jgi:hypothetical protein